MWKHFYCLLEVFCSPEVGFQVQYAAFRKGLTKIAQQHLGKVEHEQRQVEGIGQRDFFDVHEIFQAPILFGIPEIELDLKAQTVKVDDLGIGKFQVTGEQVDIGQGTRIEIGFGDDDYVERLGEIRMQHHGLIDAGLEVALHTLLNQILLRDMPVVDFLAILLARPFALLLAVVDEVQGSIIAQLGDELQAALPDHLQGVVVAKVPIQGQITDGNQVLQGSELVFNHSLNALQFLGQFNLGFILVFTAFGTTRLPWRG